MKIGAMELLLIAAFTTAFVAALVRLKKAQRAVADGPVCGACGYAVRGIASLACPECGADLREAGIVTGRQQSGLLHTLPVKLLIATVYVGIAAAVLTPLVFKHCLPICYTAFERYTLLGPTSGRYNRVDFHSHGSAVTWAVRQPRHSSLILEWVDVTLTLNDGRTIELRAGVDGRGYQYRDAAGNLVAEAEPLDEKAVLAWMRTAGIDTSGNDALNEAINVAIVVRNADNLAMASPTSATPAFAGRMRGQNGTFAGAPNIARPLAVLFWLAAWLIALRVVVIRHDRAQARQFGHEPQRPGE